MSRYITMRKASKPARASYDYEPYVQPLGQPYVYDAGPVDTGLVDKDGNPIYRTPDQIGFVRTDKEN